MRFNNDDKALGVEVKNDVEDARVLSRAIPLSNSSYI